MKKRLFPITRGEGKDYLDLAKLITEDEQGILQKVEVWENKIMTASEMYLKQWRAEGKVGLDAKELYSWIDRYLEEEYKKELR